jgi:uncharacterized caspase-like protein
MLDTTWHYAVVVGIDEYPRIDGGKYNLRCPLKDVQRMEQWLTSRQGGNLAGRVTTLTRTIPPGRRPPAPVFDEINSAILDCAEDFVTRRKRELPDEAARKAAWQTSRFYFYISGHGMDGEGDDAVLITANATRTSMNHISTRNVLNRLRKDNVFGEVVIMADCCRELAGVEVQPLPWDLRNYTGYKDATLPRAFVAYASRNRKKAYEPPVGSSIQNGIFTQALLEGLEGGVPGNQVDSKSLENFLYNYVPKLATQLSTPDQNPEIKADPGIIFVQSSKSYGVTLTAGPGSAIASQSAVDAVETLGRAVKSRVTLPLYAPGVFKGALPTGYYVAVPTGADPFTGSAAYPFAVLGEDRDATIG